MLKRLQQSSLNLLVLGASAGIFLLTFFLLQALVRARTPETITLVAPRKDLQIGETIRPEDLVEKTAYVDETTARYFTAAETAQIAGGFAALPLRAGLPIPRDAVIAAGATAERFSALLTQFPGHSFFPLPLDGANLSAPPLTLFQPGDLVAITVVIGSRPQPPATPTPSTFSYTIPGPPPTALPTLPPPASPTEDPAVRSFPPLAKDLFPQGLRVAAVHGLPAPPAPDGEAPVFDNTPDQPLLILLVPDGSRERLSLALRQGDQVFVSILGHSGLPDATAGFTYWDFEAWFLSDRSDLPLP